MAAYLEGEPVESETTGWPLERVLDMVGAILAGTVVLRAVGGLLSGLGVTSFHFDLGATAGSGLAVNQSDLFFPTYMRLQLGTSWADWTSGLALLGALALIALPRVVWDGPGAEHWSRLPAMFAVGVGAVALLTAVGASIGTVNAIWHSNGLAGPGEPLSVASGVAAVVLAILCAVLCWFALSYLRVSEDEPDLGHDPHPEPGG